MYFTPLEHYPILTSFMLISIYIYKCNVGNFLHPGSSDVYDDGLKRKRRGYFGKFISVKSYAYRLYNNLFGSY